MIPWLLSLASPGGRNGRLSILIFHRVVPATDPLFPDEMDAARFDRLCGWLRRTFHVLPLHAACVRLREGTLPARALAITFDDGYADNHDVALPILQRHGLNATFFVATGFIDGGRMWNDTIVETIRATSAEVLRPADSGIAGLADLPLTSLEQRRQALHALLGACKYLAVAEREAATLALARAAGVALPVDLMMRSDQVRSLHRAGMGVGGHTVNHPILARLELPQARVELASGKARLEELIQAPVTLFAYPNGRPEQDYRAEHARLARELGFDFAVSTAWGAASRDSDPYQIPRFTPWDRSEWRFALRLARNLQIQEVACA
jgi:peptidoglycan/xylan/chitin deacetylase (PgdA/CDA1 family)